MTIRTLILSLFFMIAALCARADRIVLADGRVLEGEIDAASTETLQQTDPMLTISIPGGKISLRRSQIASVTASTPEEKLMIAARDHYRIGRYDDAAQAIERLLASGFPPDHAAAMLMTEPEPQPRVMKSMSDEGRLAMNRVLDAVGRTGAAETPEGRLKLIRLYFAVGNTGKGESLLKALGPEFFAAHPAEKGAMTEYLHEQMQGDLQSEDYAAGAARIEALRQIDPAQSDDSQIHFYLQWARQLREKGEFAGALDVYHHYLLKPSPKIAEVFIRRTLTEAEHTFGQRGEDETAIALYEQFGMETMREESISRIVALRHNLGWRALRRGDFDEAQKHFEAEEKARPESGKQDLLQLEFRRKAAGVPDEDLLGQYELGVWAHDHALWNDAVERFKNALGSSMVNANAQAYIDKIMNQQAEVELKRLMDLYQKQEYREVLENLHGFEVAGYAQGYQAQAKRIGELTLEAMRMTVSERPQQAAALLQQAERAFYQDHYAEAEDKLQTVIQQFKDTVVYPKAMALLARVRERAAMAQLEARATPPTRPVEIQDGATSVTITSPALPDILNPPAAAAPAGEDELESFYRSLGEQKSP